MNPHKPIPFFSQYKGLAELMENSGSAYLKNQSLHLGRYLWQLESEEINFQDFKVLIRDLIELRHIEKTQDLHTNAKIRECLEEAKKLLTMT